MSSVTWFRTRSGGLTTLSLLASVATQMIWWASPAQSQSLLQQFFGMSPPVPQAQPAPRMMPPRSPINGASPRIDLVQPPPARSPLPQSQPQRGRSAPQEGSGSYTTVCVRLCDGFYFPISHRASRGRFQHDAELCRSRCGQTEARLFYHPSAGAGMSQAVDLNGRGYARLKTAFLHRKQLVTGCACKPQPWSAASIMRHQTYALNEGFNLDGSRVGIGTVTVLAGQYPDSTSEPAAESAADPAEADVQPPAENAIVPTSEARQAALGQIPASIGRAADRPKGTSARARPATRAEPLPGQVAQRAAVPAKAAARIPVGPPRPPTRVASAAPASIGLLSALGGGSTKMRWPGDQQR
jgi:hypothetical protein